PARASGSSAGTATGPILWALRANSQQMQRILLSRFHAPGGSWCHAMESKPPDPPDPGRAQRLAGLRRSLIVALQAPAARDLLPAARRALVQSIARPQLEAAVAAGAMSEREAHRILVAVEERYATAARRRLRPAAGSPAL